MLAALGGLVLASALAAAPAARALDMPPLEKAADETVLDEAPVADPCGAMQMLEGMKPRVVGQMVTSSPRWGRVTRADFTLDGEALQPLVNRLMCWTTSQDGSEPLYIAVGQKIRPLPQAGSH